MCQGFINRCRNLIYITLSQGGQGCEVQPSSYFSEDSIVTWVGSRLRNCALYEISDHDVSYHYMYVQTKFIATDANYQEMFCPKNVKIYTRTKKFEAEMYDKCYSRGSNNWSHIVKMRAFIDERTNQSIADKGKCIFLKLKISLLCLVDLCADHVILTGCRMTNFVLNFECLF